MGIDLDGRDDQRREYGEIQQDWADEPGIRRCQKPAKMVGEENGGVAHTAKLLTFTVKKQTRTRVEWN